MDKQLRKDYIKAEKIIKKNSKSFYLAFSKIENKSKRQAIYGIYAFCRYADDLADEYEDLSRLHEFRVQLDKFVRDGETPNFIFRILQDVSKKYYKDDFNYKPFYNMLKGQYADFNHKGISNLDELLDYSRLVASSVGNMLTPILAPNADAKKLAKVSNDLGIAMQITNILRDVGEDYKNGRIYLPKDMMNEFYIKDSDLASGNISNNFIEMFKKLASVAYKFYNDAYNLIYEIFPEDTKKPLLYSLVVYRGIIKSCVDNGYDVFTKRNYVTNSEKKKLVKGVR